MLIIGRWYLTMVTKSCITIDKAPSPAMLKTCLFGSSNLAAIAPGTPEPIVANKAEISQRLVGAKFKYLKVLIMLSPTSIEKIESWLAIRLTCS